MDWEDRLRRWEEELDLAAAVEGDEWVTLARATDETGVARSTLRSWYRSRQIESRVVDGPHGPTRLVRLNQVVERADQSPRLRRRAEEHLMVEAQVALLQARVERLERQVTDLLARRPPGPA